MSNTQVSAAIILVVCIIGIVRNEIWRWRVLNAWTDAYFDLWKQTDDTTGEEILHKHLGKFYPRLKKLRDA